MTARQVRGCAVYVSWLGLAYLHAFIRKLQIINATIHGCIDAGTEAFSVLLLRLTLRTVFVSKSL